MNAFRNSSLLFILQKFIEYLLLAKYYYRQWEHSSELSRQKYLPSLSPHFVSGRESDNKQNKEIYFVC